MSTKITENLLRKIIVNSAQFNTDKRIKRSQYFDWLVSSTKNNFIKVITGFRRVGKSFLLKQLREYLIQEKKIKEENIFFINFEHDFIDFNNVSGLREIWELYKTLLDNKNEKIYLFLDEIQNIKGWEKFVRTLYDSSKNKYNIFISGSNSSLLSSEFSTALGGRTIDLKIHPFNFEEYLLIEDIKIKDEFDKVRKETELTKKLNYYLQYGGLPETIGRKKEEINLYLKSILNKVLTNDIIKRFEVRKIFAIEKFLDYLFLSAGDIVSFSKIANILKEGGEEISVPTLYEYAQMYEQAFAIKRLPKFDWKNKRVFRKQYKFYIVDNGFITVKSANYHQIKGKLLENLVFNILDKKYSEIFYGQDEKGREIDFVIPQKNNSFLKIQTTLELDIHNQKRELGNFALVNKYLSKGENVLITLKGQKQTHNFQGVKIKEIPLLDLVLGEEKM